MSPIRVLADDREAASGVVDVLAEMDEVDVTVQRLPLGDYEVDARLLFERKRLIDLVVSIKDGRLLRQACRLASAPVRSILILEGTARDLEGSGMRREAIQGALVYVTLFLGIPLLRAKTPEESARLMLYAARQLRGAAQDLLPRRSFSTKRPKGKRRMQLQILQGLPGVGPGRARRLLAAFGSVEAVFNAEVDELARVPGIGGGTAAAIRWAVSEPACAYTLPAARPAL